jgi:hypothetical protein
MVGTTPHLEAATVSKEEHHAHEQEVVGGVGGAGGGSRGQVAGRV